MRGKGRGRGRGGRGGRGGFRRVGGYRRPLPSASGIGSEPSCSANTSANAVSTDLARRIALLPSFFLRHWPPRSVDFRTAQATYENLAPWGRTRFHIVDGQLYYPNLKHNTFGCVLRRTPILAWALLEMLERHQVPDVDIPVVRGSARVHLRLPFHIKISAHKLSRSLTLVLAVALTRTVATSPARSCAVRPCRRLHSRTRLGAPFPTSRCPTTLIGRSPTPTCPRGSRGWTSRARLPMAGDRSSTR